ncbi:MAG: lipoprotein [Cocleimonas sp.]
MKNLIKSIKKNRIKEICWVNWAFIIMVGGLAFISITTQLSGCGNKGNLVLPNDLSNKTSVTTVIK